jgi:hypothetical protein
MSGATKRFRCLPPHGIGLRPLEPYAELGIMFSCSSTPLFEAIRDCAAVAVGWVEVSEIDRLNIYWAAMLARQHAVEAPVLMPAHVLVDGKRRIARVKLPQTPRPIHPRPNADAPMRTLHGSHGECPSHGVAVASVCRLSAGRRGFLNLSRKIRRRKLLAVDITSSRRSCQVIATLQK